jgi:hypothetical protein
MKISFGQIIHRITGVDVEHSDLDKKLDGLGQLVRVFTLESHSLKDKVVLVAMKIGMIVVGILALALTFHMGNRGLNLLKFKSLHPILQGVLISTILQGVLISTMIVGLLILSKKTWMLAIQQLEIEYRDQQVQKKIVEALGGREVCKRIFRETRSRLCDTSMPIRICRDLLDGRLLITFRLRKKKDQNADPISYMIQQKNSLHSLWTYNHLEPPLFLLQKLEKNLQILARLVKGQHDVYKLIEDRRIDQIE